MTIPRFLFILVCLVGLTACESLQSVRETVQERMAARDAGKVRNYAKPTRETYAAARQAIEQMGYRYLRGGPAQGEIDALSGIQAEDSLRSARQVSLKVRIHSTAEGSEVRVMLTEIIEKDHEKGAGLGTETPLRDTPQYEVFFRHLAQVLGPALK